MQTIPLKMQELLNAKLCHDLANPLGTLLLSTDHLLSLTKKNIKPQEAEFLKTTSLIEKATKSAIHKHQMYRLAYGNPETSDDFTLSDLTKVIHKFNEQTKFTFDPLPPLDYKLPQFMGKLFLNLYLLGTEIIPLGGSIKGHFENKKIVFYLNGPFKVELNIDSIDPEMDTKTIQMHYTKLLCNSIERKILIKNQKDTIELSIS